MTHFAAADVPQDDLNARQMVRFEQVRAQLPVGLPVSMANSAVLLSFPQCHGDWVRPGIMLYGVSPTALATAESFGLRPVMTLMSEVIAVKSIVKGEYVGYAGAWQAERASRIAIVAVGYGDGYPRHAPTSTPVYMLGRYLPLIGRVSMDMIAVDVTDIPEVVVGTPVTLWGQGLPVAEVAEAANTISYELLCGITRRVPCYFHAPPKN
jgi:alanine racemase